MRILLAEDDESIRSVALLSLGRVGGHTVTTCENGARAVELLKQDQFDLVILDVMMPVMSGFEACERIKSDASIKNTPIVFLTAKAQVHEVQYGMSLGAIGYILKPFDPMTLPQQIKDLIKGKDNPSGHDDSAQPTKKQAA